MLKMWETCNILGCSQYQINPELGYVRHKKRKQIVGHQKRGYLRATLNRKTYRVNRLIFEHVNGAIPQNMVIDHINDIRSDNRISNLQMLTVSLNNKKTWRNRVATKGIHTPKPVLCWEKGSSDIKKYKSMYAAAKAIGVSVGMVSIICGIKNNGCKHAISKIDGKRYGFKLQSSDENPKSCPSLGCT